jgi:hypothetical protein
MRLLRVEDDGSFSLTEFILDIPAYTILSHTWGKDEEEVSYRDVTEGTGAGKAGYAKLQFCAKQAAKDHLAYMGIDTCCIDNSSSAELSEAINCMFKWYHYLSDVRGEIFAEYLSSGSREAFFDREGSFHRSRGKLS